MRIEEQKPTANPTEPPAGSVAQRREESLFCCPLCGGILQVSQHTLQCPKGHSFDRAREGYVHLLPPNRKHSKDPGDDRQMVAARTAFLERGWYLPLREALERLSVSAVTGIPSPAVLDSGCGEGWYTQGVAEALRQAGRSPRIAGIDISRNAVRKAARRVPSGEFAVASAYHLPLGDRSCDLLLDVFSPLSTPEFARVLRPGGTFLYAVPSARHLWQMKEILYPEPYENPVKREDYPGFAYVGAEELRFSITLDSSEQIMALFHMTPYTWKTPEAGVRQLESLDSLTTEVGFTIHQYRRL